MLLWGWIRVTAFFHVAVLLSWCRCCAEHAEADTFGVFTNLMSEIRDFFIKTLDDSQSGINWRLRLLMERLHHHDPHLAVRLRVQQLQPQYFAFRWVSRVSGLTFPVWYIAPVASHF